MPLIRIGIGNDYTNSSALCNVSIDWVELKALAEKQGLSAIVLDGLDKCSAAISDKMPVALKLEWIGEIMQNYEARYSAYAKAISSLSGFYNRHGYKMMILKGFACSLDWPKPDHRPCGDIDIWQFGQWKEADSVLQKELKIKIDKSHHHHTVFNWQGFPVENHYDFINVHHHKSNVEFDELLKELGKDDSNTFVLNSEKLYLPSPNLHALFLIKHIMLHFSTGEMTLRQLLDWGFYAKNHSKEIDWDWLESVLEEYGMKKLYDVFNAICVGDLGFDVNNFNKVQFDPTLKDRVFNEILSPEFPNEEPKLLFRRIFFKYRRWKANEWKLKLCYKESMRSAFWSGVKSHLMKPSSI